MSDDDLATLISPALQLELEASARRIAQAFGEQLPDVMGTGAAISTYAAAKAWADTLAATFGPGVRAAADRVAIGVRSQILQEAGLSADGKAH